MNDKKANLILTAGLDTKNVDKELKRLESEMEALRKKSEEKTGTPFGGLTDEEIKQYNKLADRLSAIQNITESTELSLDEWSKQLTKLNREYEETLETINAIARLVQRNPMLFSALSPALDQESAKLDLLHAQLTALSANAPTVDIVDADQESSDAEEVFRAIKRQYAEYQQLVKKGIKTSDDKNKISDLQKNILALSGVYEGISGKKLEIGGILDLEEDKTGVGNLTVEIRELYSELTKLEKKKIIDDAEKTRIDEIKTSISSLAEEYKKISGRDISVKGIVDTSEERTEIEILSDRISELYEEWKQINKKEIVDNDEIRKASQLKKEIKELAGEYRQLTGAKLHIEGITEIPKANKKAEISFKRLNKKIRTVALSLFSLRTLYALLSRASSAYLAQDTELAKKLQSVWLGLGSFLQPLLESLANLMLKGIGYINEFVKALTGIDYVARANAKALEKQASAQGKANKQLFSFDKINKLSDTTSGGSSSIKDGLQVDIPELDEKIVEKLQNLAYWLKENWDLVKFLTEALIILFVGTKAMEIIAGIGKIAGALGLIKTGNAVTEVGKLSTALGWLLTLGLITVSVAVVVTTYKKVKQEFQDLKDWQDKLDENWDEIVDQLYTDKYNDELGVSRAFEHLQGKEDVLLSTLHKVNFWADKNIDLSEYYLDNAKRGVRTQYDVLQELKKQYDQGKLNTLEQDNYLEEIGKTYNYYLLMIPKLEKLGIDTSGMKDEAKILADNMLEVGKNLGYTDEDLDKMLVSLSYSDKATKDMYKGLENINKLTFESKDLSVNVDADTTKANSKISNFVNTLKTKFSNLLAGLGGGGGGGRGFAEGGIIGTKYLASGGIVGTPVASIVNAPNRGVYLGNGAIAGERGPEAVLPLTNEATMKKIGQEIGQWVTIGLNITNEIDGKVLNKRLETIKREGNFATNGGKL